MRIISRSTPFVFFILLLAISYLLFAVPAHAQTVSPEERAQLEAELKLYEEEVAKLNALLEEQAKQSGTIQGDINILTSKIKRAQAAIKARTITIQKLGREITQKTATIKELTQKIDRETESLAQLVRKTNEFDDRPPVHAFLTGRSISDFYLDLDAFITVKGAIKRSLDEIQGAKTKKEEEREALEERQDEEEGVREELQSEKKTVERNEAEQKQLLAVSKSKEREYEAVLSERRKKVAEIRSKLFQFAGGVDPIPFERALRYAEEAGARLGVRAAFILAILTQESRLGANVGACFISNTVTGEGFRANGAAQDRVMSPERDIPVFLDITKELGRDPFATRVSCPQRVGWGGAMGPSQFIPSTWKLFRTRIAAAVEKTVPDPWTDRDAIFATTIYVSDLGAKKQTYSAERTAACRYYSGRSCTALRAAATYGSSVMTIAKSIQSDIDYLKQYGVSRR